MRSVLLVALLLSASSPATAQVPAKLTAPADQLKVWNTKAALDTGAWEKITIFGGHPDAYLAACRCVAGVWQPGRKGESATHFTGTVQGASLNHARAGSQKLTAKVRKTRHLMYALGDHRAKLHAIMRGSGQVILREVKGGEWELAGYAENPLGDLFGNNKRWRSDPKQPPKPGDASPIPDPAKDAVALAKLINDYRASIKLPRLPMSPALTKVAQAHVVDLNVNKPVVKGCNMHSWSAKGAWTACCYDGSKTAARCMWNKPKEIAKYPGYGYEIAALYPAGMTPELALSQWQNSPAHHEVMINQGIWTQPWGAMGVALEGDYSVAWFGHDVDRK
ncbi:MAG: hypothetical protein H0T42_14830 [Deltaproteobacteria bacterium]|nr:hypothetical protein [Deltaproteobacteria bacterium]